MSLRGGDRRSKSAAQRQVDGSRTRPRHDKRKEFALVALPLEDYHEPPEALGLSDDEIKIWRTFAPDLAGAFTHADLQTFANFCIAIGQVRDIRTQQGNDDYTRTVVDENGTIRAHPLDAQLRQWLQTARLTAAELGLSPASRTRISAAAGDDEPDEGSPLEMLMRQRDKLRVVK